MPQVPWYDKSHDWIGRAGEFLHALKHVPTDAPQRAQLRAFEELSAIRLIFESNLMEGAGASSGETKKIVQQYFPSLPDTVAAHLATTAKDAIAECMSPDRWEAIRAQVAAIRDLSELVPTVSYKGRARPVREVAQHFDAYLDIKIRALTFSMAQLVHDFLTKAPNSTIESIVASESVPSFAEYPEWKYLDEAIAAKRKTPKLPHPPLLSVEFLRKVHRTLAEGLLPSDAGVRAGEWRIDNRSIDLQVAFPAPELVPGAMEKLVAKYVSPKASKTSPPCFAADLSYDFVAIHPFPDFNGRVSRLLINLVLMASGVPFPVPLRASKSGKHKYIHSLQRANRGKLDRYHILIASRVVDCFEEVEDVLRRSDVPTLLDAMPPKCRKADEKRRKDRTHPHPPK